MTTYTPTIDNMQDVLDSRDIIKHIENLVREIDAAHEPITGLIEGMDDEQEELAVLLALEEEAKASPDWEYGETLIRDSYFREYAEQLADDIGMTPDSLTWPLTHIDWEAAARELQYDYFSVDFDGVTYWIRN